jgi:hypothetical protein
MKRCIVKIENTFNLKHPELAGMDIVNRELGKSAVRDLENVIVSGSETKIHKFLAVNPIVFEPLLDRVGHHAMWSKNKPHIRPKLTNGKNGKIPDLLLAGKGSGGIEWFFVELKSPKEKLFRGKVFSPTANSGLIVAFGTMSGRDALVANSRFGDMVAFVGILKSVRLSGFPTKSLSVVETTAQAMSLHEFFRGLMFNGARKQPDHLLAGN